MGEQAERPTCPKCKIPLVLTGHPKMWECGRCKERFTPYAVGVARFLQSNEIPNGVHNSPPDRHWRQWYENKN